MKDILEQILKHGIIEKGYQVITFDCPQVDKNSFIDKGSSYRSNYIKYLNWLVETTDQESGMAIEKIIGGISFGGLHTLIAMEELNYFDRYFTVIGVIDPTILDRFKNLDMSNFSAINSSEHLLGKKGIMVWGDSDSATNPELSRTLYSQLSETVIGIEVSNNVHEVLQEHVSSVLNWL